MKADDKATNRDSIYRLEPARTDFVYNLVKTISRKNPFLTGATYFVVSFLGMYVLGYFSGQLHGRNGLAPMYSQIVDNVNLAFLAPVGAGLLCNLYNRIEIAFAYVVEDKLIEQSGEPEYRRLMKRLDWWYNNLWAVACFLIMSISINTVNYVYKTDSFLSINGGITGLYGRFFITINFFLIGLIIYKCIVTVIGVRTIFKKFHVKIRPMHPDRSGGLEPVGKLAIGVSSVIGLVMAFFAILFFFDADARSHIHFHVAFIIVYFMSPYFLFAILARGSEAMRKIKKESLDRLRLTFDEYYRKLQAPRSDSPYELKAAEEIVKIQELYKIVDAMPVWPFDAKTLFRYLTMFFVPAGVFAADVIVNNFDALLRVIGR